MVMPVVAATRTTSAIALTAGNQSLVEAAREGHLVSLRVSSSSSSPVAVLSHTSKWDVSRIDANPHLAMAHWVATAINQKAVVWDLHAAAAAAAAAAAGTTTTPNNTTGTTAASKRPQQQQTRQRGAIVCELTGHSRAVTDLQWSPTDPHLLATCSMDASVRVWDVRSPARAVVTVSAWTAGAACVRWDPHSTANGMRLASCHANDVRVWDLRANEPLMLTTNAHSARTTGISWSPSTANMLATCSLDRFYKRWTIETGKVVLDAAVDASFPLRDIAFAPWTQDVALVVPNRIGEAAAVMRFDSASPIVRLGDASSKQVVWNVSKQEQSVLALSMAGVLQKYPLRTEALEDMAFDADKLTLLPVAAPIAQAVPPQVHVQPPSPAPPPAPGLAVATTEEELVKPRSETIVLAPTTPEPVEDGTTSRSRSRRQSFMSIAVAAAEEALPDRSLSSAAASASAAAAAAAAATTTATSVASNLTPQSLSHEFHLLGQIKNVSVDQVNPQLRMCIVSASSATRSAHIRMRVSFPLQYPYSAAPSFEIVHSSSLSTRSKTALVDALLQVAELHVNNNRPCLEACLRQLHISLDDLTSSSDADAGSDSDSDKEAVLNRDDNIPFPRLSAAVFASNGMLVRFSNKHRLSATAMGRGTPRSLQELQSTIILPQSSQQTVFALPGAQSFLASTGAVGGGGLTSTSSFLADALSASGNLGATNTDPEASGVLLSSSDALRTVVSTRKAGIASVVSVLNVSMLLPLNRALGEKYRLFPRRPHETCLHNAKVAQQMKRKDLVKVWKLAALVLEREKSIRLIANGNSENDAARAQSFWSSHPMGAYLVRSLIAHYERIGDFQMLAMLSCVFADVDAAALAEAEIEHKQAVDKHEGEQYQLSLKQQQINEQDVKQAEVISRMLAELSFGTVAPTTVTPQITPAPLTRRTTLPPPKPRPAYLLLEQHRKHVFEGYRMQYADILYRWRLFAQRAEVLKYTEQPAATHLGLEFDLHCTTCDRVLQTAKCSFCRQFAAKCSICHISVTGSSLFCIVCGHGGHSQHIQAWFSKNSVCPVGCDCSCTSIRVTLSAAE